MQLCRSIVLGPGRPPRSRPRSRPGQTFRIEPLRRSRRPGPALAYLSPDDKPEGIRDGQWPRARCRSRRRSPVRRCRRTGTSISAGFTGRRQGHTVAALHRHGDLGPSSGSRSPGRSPYRRRPAIRCSGAPAGASKPDLTRGGGDDLAFSRCGGTGRTALLPVLCPTGWVADVICARCGDGPLFAADLAVEDDRTPAVVQGWLSAAGWQLSGPVCPDCVGELAR